MDKKLLLIQLKKKILRNAWLFDDPAKIKI